MIGVLRVVVPVVLATLPLACGGDRVEGEDDGLPAPPAAVAVSVDNDNWSDVTVYAVYNGTRARLGTVTSMTGETFVVPPAFASQGELRLLLDPIGGDAYLTEPILVQPGQVIELTIENRLPQSHWIVR